MFSSVVDQQTAINSFVGEHNDDPKPVAWTADPDFIIAAVKRGYQVLDAYHWFAHTKRGLCVVQQRPMDR